MCRLMGFNAQDKMLTKYGVSKELDYSGFVNSDGSFIVLPDGVEHYYACELAKTTIMKYLDSGGVRVLVSLRASEICVENSIKELTDEQLHTISKIIRMNKPMRLVCLINDKEFYIDNITGVKFHQFEKALSGEKQCIKC